MEKKVVLVACGTGIATSTVVNDAVTKLAKANNIPVEIIQCKMMEVPGYADRANLLITTTVADKSKYKLDFNESYKEEYNAANELRAVIGKIPNLSIYIDEVHHAVDEDIKLRYVVNNWTSNGTINSVIGSPIFVSYPTAGFCSLSLWNIALAKR